MKSNTPTEDLKNLIAQELESRKAENVSIIKLPDNNSPIADYMIIASGRSSKNVSSIAENIAKYVKANTDRNIKIEGLANAQWVILDTGDIIVHIFHPEAREQYGLEQKLA